MGKIYINCSRCGKDLECEELCDVYTSKIDDSFICKDCYKKEKPDYIQQLKQQLEEKDKEIEDWKQKTQTFLNRVSEQNYEIANNNPTQLAIQELEKVHAMLVSKAREVVGTGVVAVRLYTINEVINQRIKELKGEKDVTN